MEQIAIKLGFEYIKTCHEYTRHQILELIETSKYDQLMI